MSTSAALSSKPLALHIPVALQIHGFLVDLDPSRWQRGVEAALRTRAEQLRAAIEEMASEDASSSQAHAAGLEVDARVSAQLRDIAKLLNAVPGEDLQGEQLRDRWQQLRKQLQTAYEALRRVLRAHAVNLPTVRPTNYTRSVVHMGLAVVCIALAEVLPHPWLWVVPLGFTLFFWFLESLRHFSSRARAFLLEVFRRIAHPHERTRVNSSTWFVSGLTLLALTLDRPLAAVAVAVLGFADPVAGLVGRRFGRTKLINQRSLEGSLAFVVAGTLAGLAVLSLFHGDMAFSSRAFIAFGAALVGSVAELCSAGSIDDNFAVPLGAGLGGWIAWLLMAS